MTKREEVLETVIAGELEANVFYAQVAERAADPSVRQTFTDLAQDELSHRDFLEQARRDPSLVSRVAAPSDNYKVAEATELPTLSIDMKPADAIALAMKKEQAAVELYARLAASVSVPELAAMLTGLSNMERGHKARLEALLVQIGYPEAF